MQPLIDAIHRTQAKVVVELGSQEGHTTARLAEAAEKYGGIVVTMDCEDYSSLVLSKTSCIFLHGKSEDIGRMWHGPIDVLFVDSAPNNVHTAEQVTLELNIWAKHVRGTILFHDTISFPAVREAVLKWQAAHAGEWTELEEMAPNSYTGMGQIWRK